MLVLDTRTHVLSDLIADLNALPVRTDIHKVHEMIFALSDRNEKPVTRRTGTQLRAFLPTADISRGFHQTTVEHTLVDSRITTSVTVPFQLGSCVVHDDDTMLVDIEARPDFMGSLARMSSDDNLVLAINASDRDTVEPRLTFRHTVNRLLGAEPNAVSSLAMTHFLETGSMTGSSVLLDAIETVFATAASFVESGCNRADVHADAAHGAAARLGHIGQVIKANSGRPIIAFAGTRVLFEVPKSPSMYAVLAWAEGFRDVHVKGA